MDIVELFIDETDEVSGIEAISVVANGAIESDFVALKNQEFKLAEVDKEFTDKTVNRSIIYTLVKQLLEKQVNYSL